MIPSKQIAIQIIWKKQRILQKLYTDRIGDGYEIDNDVCVQKQCNIPHEYLTE